MANSGFVRGDYLINIDQLPDNYRSLYYHYNEQDSTNDAIFSDYVSNGFVDITNILEMNHDNNFNDTAICFANFYDSLDNKLYYVNGKNNNPSYTESFPNILYNEGKSLFGLLRGESPSFKRCLFDSSEYDLAGATFIIRFQNYDDGDYDAHPYIRIGVYDDQDKLVRLIGDINRHDNDLSNIPHKLLFVLQGAGGGGGGGAGLGELFAGGSGGGSGGLAAVIVDLSKGLVGVGLGKGGVGSNEASHTNGADGEYSFIVQGTEDEAISCIVYGGKGGGYAREINISGSNLGGGAGGTVDNKGFPFIIHQNGAKGGDRGGTERSENGANFGITKITLPTSQLVYKELNASGGTGGGSPRYAGGGAGSFFGNGGDGGKDNAGKDGNPGKNGGYGAGGGGGGDAALNDTYGKGGNGGDAVLKIYY
jgi:hypothetical protein